MRFRLWTLVCCFALASCGQPLRVSTRPSTTPAATRTVPLASSAAPTVATSNSQSETPTVQDTQATEVVTATVPTAVPPERVTPSVAVIPRTVVPQTNAEAWQAQQAQLQTFEAPKTYVASSPITLWWFDPTTGQSLQIGRVSGAIQVDATFVLQRTGEPALRVVYRINQDYGLTAISPAVQSRMQAAGFTEQVEAYVVQNDSVVAQ